LIDLKLVSKWKIDSPTESFVLLHVNFTKLYSLEEAQSTLPSILPKVAEMAELKATLDQKGWDVNKHQYLGGMGPNGQKVFPPQMERLVAILKELNEVGIEVKDLNKGLVDFPHRRENGEVVYLCYVLGEPKIQAWHTIEGGFRGRQPLDSL
jgi:hypothetical protein